MAVDMPLEKLYQYTGRNPRPDDFDEFWDKSVAEVYAIDPQATFERVDFPSVAAECYDLTFTGTKGARIYAKFVKPAKTEGKIPAVLTFHGFGAMSGSWRSLLPLASQGFAVAMMDCRGQGGRSQDVGGTVGTTTPAGAFIRGVDGPPEDILARQIFLDTVQLARVVMGLDYVDEQRVATSGGSQGGALALICAALVPSIKLCTAAHPFYSDYKRVWEMGLDAGPYEGLRYYFRHFDPRHENEDAFFEKLGYIDTQFFAPRIKAKVLMATGLRDNMCPPSTQFATYNKLTCEKEYLFYPEYGHEVLEGYEDIVFRFLSEI